VRVRCRRNSSDADRLTGKILKESLKLRAYNSKHCFCKKTFESIAESLEKSKDNYGRDFKG